MAYVRQLSDPVPQVLIAPFAVLVPMPISYLFRGKKLKSLTHSLLKSLAESNTAFLNILSKQNLYQHTAETSVIVHK